MASSEKFCLKWNDFESNISNGLRDLRNDRDFFDVTLACDDDQLEAHKVIVSACSPLLRNILKKNPHQHPLLYLRGVKYKELVSVLNFMYQGEVNVAQDDLNCFLSVAEELQVKGLTQEGSQSQSQRHSHSQRTEAKSEKKSRPAPAQSVVEDDDIQEVSQLVKSEPGGGGIVEDHQAGAVALEDSYQEEAYDYEAYDDGTGVDPNTGMPFADGNKAVMDSMMTSLGGGRWECQQCGFQSKSTNVRYHIESKHLNSPYGYSCSQCSEVLKTRNALNTHLSVKHRQQV